MGATTGICRSAESGQRLLPGLRTDVLDLALAPNPANELVAIQISNLKSDGQLAVIDATGRVVQSRQIQADAQQTVQTVYLQCGKLPEGLYTISVLADGVRSSSRLVLQR